MVCKKSKNPSMFSGKQLSDLRFKIYRFGQGSIPAEGCIKCEQCTGKQRTEMKCCRCDKVRPLDKFSLAQRRKKDEPVCMACQEDVDWLAPDERDFTTGPDDAVHEDYESDYSDTSSQVYEITESGVSEVVLSLYHSLTFQGIRRERCSYKYRYGFAILHF